MTGRELILYILENELENEEVFKDGTFIGFVSVEEAAVRMDVGVSTVEVWCSIKAVDSIYVGDKYFISIHSLDHLAKLKQLGIIEE